MQYIKSYDNFINESNSVKTVSFVAVGDMLAHNAIHSDSYTDGEYDYTNIFSVLKDRISQYELKFCNAETPITDGKIHGGEIGEKGTAIFSANRKFGDAIIDAGFNLISLANNHVLDNGTEGIDETKKYWENTNAIVSGLDDDTPESRVKLFDKNGIKIAFVSYTTRVNTMRKKYVEGINLWNEQYGIRDILYAKQNADAVIVSMHWGTEYMLGSTNKEQDHISNLLSQLGVNVIIGTHPHVIQPVKWLGETLCVYSLGNCVARQKGDDIEKRIGGMVAMDIVKENGSISIKNVQTSLNYICYDEFYNNIKVVPFSELTDAELEYHDDINKQYSGIFVAESINDYIDEKIKLSKENKDRLIKYDERYGKIMDKYHKEKSHFQNITNMSELISRYKKHLRENDDYDLTFDKIEYEKSAWSNENEYKRFMDDIQSLMDDFQEFQVCYLTRYYLDKLNTVKKNIKYIHDYVNGKRKLPKNFYRPSNYLYNQALKYIKENPVEDIHDLEKEDSDYKRTITPKEAKDEMEKEIKKNGYDWKVELDDNLVPRMSVKTYKKFLINAHSNFSKVDIDSLKRHEVNTHVARKDSGIKTGLNLFLYGLHGAGKYDEGMAIYNSLDKSPKPKPNIMFYISKKIIILKHLFTMSTDELVQKIMKMTDTKLDDALVGIIRAMRVVFWNENYATSLDASYLTGYEEIRKMDDSARRELIKYNIGPDQLYELPTIKKFLKDNGFEK